MIETKRMESKDAHMKELYAAIGEFIVIFETLSNALKLGMLLLMPDEGDQKAFINRFSKFRARSARNYIMNQVDRSTLLTEIDESIFNAILDEIDAVIDVRNDILHSTALIDWESKTAENIFQEDAFRFIKESTSSTSNLHFTVADYSSCTERAKSLITLIGILFDCIAHKGSLESVFNIDGAGVVTAVR